VSLTKDIAYYMHGSNQTLYFLAFKMCEF